MEAPLSEAVARVLALDNGARAEVTQARVGRAVEAFAARPGDTGSSSCQSGAASMLCYLARACSKTNRGAKNAYTRASTKTS